MCNPMQLVVTGLTPPRRFIRRQWALNIGHRLLKRCMSRRYIPDSGRVKGKVPAGLVRARWPVGRRIEPRATKPCLRFLVSPCRDRPFAAG